MEWWHLSQVTSTRSLEDSSPQAFQILIPMRSSFFLFFNLVRCIFVFNPNERHFYENVSKCVFLKKWKKDMIYKTTWQCKHLKGQLDPLSVKWRFLIKRGQLDPFVGWFAGAKRDIENISKLYSGLQSSLGLLWPSWCKIFSFQIFADAIFRQCQ